MQIKQFEQSGVLLTSQSGHTLAIDIASLTPLDSVTDLQPNAMLVSHIHGDHFSPEHIAAIAPNTLYTGAECLTALGDTAITTHGIVAGETYTIGDFSVTPFAVDHGPNATMVPQQNFGFMIAADGETLYFAGDMYTPSGIDVTNLSVDYTFLPVGGHFTFDAEAAFAFAKTFAQIGTVYPMHYEAVGPIDTDGATTFKALARDTFSVA